MAFRVEPGRKVRISYRIQEADGRLLEERTPETPYEYVQGSGQILAAVEQALLGKPAGFKTEIHLSPREGYGDYDPGLVVDLPRASFPNPDDLKVGMKFNTRGPSGETLTVRVIDLEDEQVTVDGNHPLAGLELVFDVQILDVLDDDPSPGGSTVH